MENETALASKNSQRPFVLHGEAEPTAQISTHVKRNGTRDKNGQRPFALRGEAIIKRGGGFAALLRIGCCFKATPQNLLRS